MLKATKGLTALLAGLALSLTLLATPVHAGGHKGKTEPGYLVRGITPDRAASIARDATGGRVLKVQRKNGAYNVRVLLDGERVRNVRVDAATGRIMN